MLRAVLVILSLSFVFSSTALAHKRNCKAHAHKYICKVVGANYTKARVRWYKRNCEIHKADVSLLKNGRWVLDHTYYGEYSKVDADNRYYGKCNP